MTMQYEDILEAYSKAFKDTAMGDPENVITVHQSIYRLFAAGNSEWKVFHASGVAVNGKGIIFGDDGLAIGKTTQSLYLYKVLKDKGVNVKYIADEYVIYRDGYIYPNKYAPISVKSTSKEYIEKIFGKYEKFFKLPPEEFIDNPVRLHAMICVNPNPGENKLTRLPKEAAKAAWKCTAYAHLVKLRDPGYDRFSIFTKAKQEGIVIKDIRKAVESYPDFNLDIPVYDLQISDPSNLVPILERHKIFMSKTPINHISCGGILFNESGNEVFLIFKISRDEWRLPKGRVEHDEEWTETALREVYEETGYKNLRLLDTQPVGIDEYDWEDEKDPEHYNHKEVKYYAIQIRDAQRDQNTQDKGEDLDGAWLPIEIALEKLSFDSEKRVLKTAIQKLQGRLVVDSIV